MNYEVGNPNTPFPHGKKVLVVGIDADVTMRQRYRNYVEFRDPSEIQSKASIPAEIEVVCLYTEIPTQEMSQVRSSIGARQVVTASSKAHARTRLEYILQGIDLDAPDRQRAANGNGHANPVPSAGPPGANGQVVANPPAKVVPTTLKDLVLLEADLDSKTPSEEARRVQKIANDANILSRYGEKITQSAVLQCMLSLKRKKGGTSAPRAARQPKAPEATATAPKDSLTGQIEASLAEVKRNHALAKRVFGELDASYSAQTDMLIRLLEEVATMARDQHVLRREREQYHNDHVLLQEMTAVINRRAPK